MKKNRKFWFKVTNVATIGSILIFDSGLVYIMADAIYVNNESIEYAVVMTGLMFCLLSFMFLFIGCLIQARLKKYFPVFYKENRTMLWIATFSLTICLIIRGILDTVRYFIPSINKKLNKNEALYNFFSFLFCDIIPICFQLSTLIFGYIRKRNQKKSKGELIQNQDDVIIVYNTYDNSITDSLSIKSGSSSYFDPPL